MRVRAMDSTHPGGNTVLRFIGPLIVVEDMPRSRQFYEEVLGQKVNMDFGENVGFEGDFAIHLKTHFQGLLGEPDSFPVAARANNGELYFEADDIEAVHERLKRREVEFVHEPREQPWGQRVMRVYDPDGHIVEIGEPLEAVVLRFHKQGLSTQDISARTSLPPEVVETMLAEQGGGR